MENRIEKEATYVLFGSEAIRIYKISIDLLLASSDVKYKIGAFTEIRAFVDESKKWDGFFEIDKNDFLRLKKATIDQTPKSRKARKRNILSIFKLFK